MFVCMLLVYLLCHRFLFLFKCVLEWLLPMRLGCCRSHTHTQRNVTQISVATNIDTINNVWLWIWFGVQWKKKHFNKRRNNSTEDNTFATTTENWLEPVTFRGYFISPSSKYYSFIHSFIHSKHFAYSMHLDMFVFWFVFL